jgi:putative restriction endonuclease
MNSFERSLIQKAGYDHGWEVVIEDTPEQVVLASALHRARAQIIPSLPGCRWVLTVSPEPIQRELERALPDHFLTDEWMGADDDQELGQLLSHAARLARALPDEPSRRFAGAVAEKLAALDMITAATEIERLVRQRVGQDIYRESLLDYWGGACAVTGIAIPELLRASHAKSWADCASDAERLNVYNGFLLTAHLDALFDRHLMTFSDGGEALFAPKIDSNLQSKLGISGCIRLRWIRGEHLPFLRHHRATFDCSTADTRIEVAPLLQVPPLS